MWVDAKGSIIQDTDAYIGEYTEDSGTVLPHTYPAQFPKDQIAGLQQVTEVARPDETPTGYTVDGQPRGGVVVTGFTMNGVIQVWTTTARQELSAKEQAAIDARDAKSSASRSLIVSDTTVLRCYEAGVALPADWKSYRSTLRDIISGRNAGPLPAMPSYPTGT